jgi:hypothetical protein
LKSKYDLCTVHQVFPIFSPSFGKNDPHIRVLLAFPDDRWGKSGGKNSLDLKAFGGLYMGCNSAVFWQTEQLLGIFSTRTEKEHNTEISGIGTDIGKRK